jgi:hypothetical protein
MKDESTSTGWHGEIAVPGPTPWNLGRQSASGELSGGRRDSYDEHVFYLLGGRDYEFRLTVRSPAAVPLTVLYLPVPAVPSGPTPVVRIGLSTADTRSATFHAASTGFYHFGVAPGLPVSEGSWAGAGYELRATLVGDDHPDTAAEAYILPGWMGDGVIGGRVGRGDVDHFRL